MTVIFANMHGLPVVPEEDHVLYDEVICGGDTIGHAFQSHEFYLPSPASIPRKILGENTNMLVLGSIPAFCSKEIGEITVLAPELEAGTKVKVALVLCERKMCEAELPIGRPTRLALYGTKLVLGEVRLDTGHPLLLSPMENFRITVESPVVTKVRVELKGSFWKPEFNSALYMKWKANEVAREASHLDEAFTPSVSFDRERLVPNKETGFFVSGQYFADGTPKRFHDDTNMHGWGYGFPRGYLKCVTDVSIDVFDAKVDEEIPVKLGTLDHVFREVRVKPGEVAVIDPPLFYLPMEHLAITAGPVDSNACARLNLHGPLFSPRNG